MKKNKTFKLALGGICLALTIIFMFAGSIAPGVELTLFAISSVFVAVMILESGVGGGVILYLAAVILGLILVPNKVGLIPYVFLFGYYGLVKFFIEKLKSAVAQIIVKAIFFAAVLCIGFLGFKELLLGAVSLPDMPIVILIIAGVLFLLLYDYIYTLAINLYITKVQRKGIDNFKLS
ncbi:MAG: hypothetical protein Q4B18_00215 [Bacillota bacterium]|nr:hypothetical protein [Bacillota bacterium]